MILHSHFSMFVLPTICLCATLKMEILRNSNRTVCASFSIFKLYDVKSNTKYSSQIKHNNFKTIYNYTIPVKFNLKSFVLNLKRCQSIDRIFCQIMFSTKVLSKRTWNFKYVIHNWSSELGEYFRKKIPVNILFLAKTLTPLFCYSLPVQKFQSAIQKKYFGICFKRNKNKKKCRLNCANEPVRSCTCD